MSDSTKAVFLSYASQDAAAVQRICEALRAAGVEVWFDRNELGGGDGWDRKIRGQIGTCVLFAPMISAHTQARREGYFRLEWKLAAQRTHMMSERVAFLLPIVIDDTTDAEADVPAEFKAVQWTRLPGGETSEKFCARVLRLLGGSELEPGRPRPGKGAERGEGAASPASAPAKVGRRVPAAAWGVAVLAVALAAGGYFWVKRPAESAPISAQNAGAGTRPPTAATFSEARQLAERAGVLSLRKYNSTADDFAAAEGLLKQALAFDQNDAEIWAISSQFNTAIRTRGFDDAPARREAARSQAERALKLDPNSTEALFALGRWQRDNDPDRTVAEKTFLAVLARAPDHEGALGNLGTLYSRQDRVEEALAMFERAARNPATLPLARYSQYLAYFGHGRFEEAERAVRESIAAEPSSNSVSGLAMVLLTAKGDAAAAVRALAEVPAAHRNEHRPVWMAAFAHLAAREPEAALTALRRLSADFVQDNWFTGPTAYWAGRAHAQAGRAEAARIAFESGVTVMDAKLKATPGDSALHVARGELLAWLGRTEEALRAARTATELAGGRENVFWFRSPVRIYAALGRADEALPLLEKHCARDSRAVLWPLTPALLRIDPLWDKLRGDPRFQALTVEPKPVEKQSAVAPKPDDKSVAVLAFANLSDDKGNEYFSDGISEELLNVLGRVPGLRVAAPMSAFSFKGKNVSAQEIGQKLNVAYLVNGSVRRAGTAIRVVARLSRADTDEQIWTEKFDGEAKNVFALQDEIAGKIAAALSLKLGASARAAKPIDPEAYRLYLEGRHLWSLRTLDNLDRAEVAFKSALQLEPESALIHAGLAELYATRALYRALAVLPEAGDLGRAAEQADRAIALDPKLSQGYVARATIALARRDYAGAERLLRESLALAPNDALALNRLGDAMIHAGRLDAGLENYQRALQLDPLSVFMVRDVVRESSYAHRYQEAIEVAKRFEAAAPRDTRLSIGHFHAQIQRGMADQAATELKALLPTIIRPENFSGPGVVEWVFFLREAKLEAESEALAKQLLSRFGPDTYLHALILMARGRTEEALPLLKPFPPGSQDRLYWSPIFDPVRADPRFLRKIEEFPDAAEYKVARATLARMLREQEAKK